MRRSAILSLVVGLLLLPAAAAVALSEHDRRRAAEQRRTDQVAMTQAGAVGAYFARARAIVSLTASVGAFRHVVETPAGRRVLVARRPASLRDATRQLAYLERLYPASIGEACFISRDGGEFARVVAGRVAPASDLSEDEAAAVFFAPAFALHRRGVHQSAPYRSPDTHSWVISNSAPVFADGARRPAAIVHFEVTIESFRRALAASVPAGEDLRIVDVATGTVVADARRPQRLAAPLGDRADRRFTGLTWSSGPVRIDGRIGAARRIAGGAGNANRWVVVALARDPSSLLAGVGPAPLALLVGGLLLVGFAAATLRGARRELERAAHFDALTGLPNRRSLFADLERRAANATPAAPVVVLLFDLNGFKGYNDTFGHLAGDALLARLGQRVADAVAPWGRAYRLGGDEFCVVGDGLQRARIEASAAAAFEERGEGFRVTASYGSVSLPEETTDGVEALRLADQRMYAAKESRAAGPAESKAVLLRTLVERHPELGDHAGEVAELVAAVARQLGVEDPDLRHVVHAAELHDIGKMAIPDAIISKPGPLNADEWAFMRRHTLIGERIVAAAPSLAATARLVRWSHERWDGAGYPDGLAGEDIPLGARIVCACDAYDAIVGERPYRRARTAEQALAELRRCAGTHFDPAVVTAIEAVLSRRSADAAAPVSASS